MTSRKLSDIIDELYSANTAPTLSDDLPRIGGDLPLFDADDEFDVGAQQAKGGKVLSPGTLVINASLNGELLNSRGGMLLVMVNEIIEYMNISLFGTVPANRNIVKGRAIGFAVFVETIGRVSKIGERPLSMIAGATLESVVRNFVNGVEPLRDYVKKNPKNVARILETLNSLGKGKKLSDLTAIDKATFETFFAALKGAPALFQQTLFHLMSGFLKQSQGRFAEGLLDFDVARSWVFQWYRENAPRPSTAEKKPFFLPPPPSPAVTPAVVPKKKRDASSEYGVIPNLGPPSPPEGIVYGSLPPAPKTEVVYSEAPPL